MQLDGISVIVPVYNSEETLATLIERLEQALAPLAKEAEILLVNDASSDGSWAVVEELSRVHANVHGINLMRNFGQHNALLAGIRAARHAVIVTLDDDLQNPPEEIPKLLEELDKGFDVVYGSPAEEQHGLWRDLASTMTKLALKGAMGVRTARNVSAFRVFRTEIREAFATYQSAYVSIDVLLTWGTTRFSSVVVRHDPRGAGQSNYTLRKLAVHALNMLTGFSTLPLKLASLTGFAFMLFGIAVLAYVLIVYLIYGRPVPGFPFLASIIAVFSGVQLFCLGVIGEYLGRIHIRSMNRPSYVVRRSID
jgi:glycosyltransferase involved in cell wall biosynthesis